MLLNGILKSIMPKVNNFCDSGKIDSLIREIKKPYNEQVNAGNSVEIMISTENDGSEYVSVVELEPVSLTICRIFQQMKLSELIKLIVKTAQN